MGLDPATGTIRWNINGFADIGGGRLTDDDFVSDQGATSFGTGTPGAQRISRTGIHAAGLYGQLSIGSARAPLGGRAGRSV